MTAATQNARDIVQSLCSEPPRAAAFIVTVYGDVVEPRGGVLWMGSLIATCALAGITETLVRTAVSRLVEAGQLIGEREGRRSYYRLTPAAHIEFTIAAEALFAPRKPENWLFLNRRSLKDETAMLREGFAIAGPELLIGTERKRNIDIHGLAFRASATAGGTELPDIAARLWPLEAHAAQYKQFISAFAPLDARLESGGALDESDCLIARLMLVHEFRGVLLRDPRLPEAALPPDWPGKEAGALFAGLYRQLSGPANRWIGRTLSATDGMLPADTEATKARLISLSTAFPAASATQ